jgi:hypothetical protein
VERSKDGCFSGEEKRGISGVPEIQAVGVLKTTHTPAFNPALTVLPALK